MLQVPRFAPVCLGLWVKRARPHAADARVCSLFLMPGITETPWCCRCWGVLLFYWGSGALGLPVWDVG